MPNLQNVETLIRPSSLGTGECAWSRGPCDETGLAGKGESASAGPLFLDSYSRSKMHVFDILGQMGLCGSPAELDLLLQELLQALHGPTHFASGRRVGTQGGNFQWNCRIVGPAPGPLQGDIESVVQQAVVEALKLQDCFHANPQWIGRHAPALRGDESPVCTMQVYAQPSPSARSDIFFALLNPREDSRFTEIVMRLALPVIYDAQQRLYRMSSSSVRIKLTPRERAVLRHVLQGKSDREMAETFDRSIHTVKNQMRKLLLKFRVSRRAELACVVNEHRLLLDDGADLVLGPVIN